MAITRHVTSPAGERIELVSDDDWMQLTGASEKAIKMWRLGSKRFVLAELWNGGLVTDAKTGRCTHLLWQRMRGRFPDETLSVPNSFPQLSNDPLNAPAFEVNKRHKRTYGIKLVALPQTWYDKLMADENERAKERRRAEQERERQEAKRREAQEVVPHEEAGEPIAPEPERTWPEPTEADAEEFERLIQGMELDAPTIYDVGPPLDISMASQVAMSLLTTVVEIISAGSGAAVDEKVRKLQGDLNDVMAKLSARLEDNDRLRRQIRQAGDEITALRHERDGLRSRLRATEANLTAALKGDAVAAINGEIQRRVDQIMRVSPTTKGDE